MRDIVMLLHKLDQAVVVISRRLDCQHELLMPVAAFDGHQKLVVIWVVKACLLC